VLNRVEGFFELTMLHVVLYWQKISETILEKAVFFVLWRFYFYSVFVLKNSKKNPSER
jgi:hypothetical protein